MSYVESVSQSGNSQYQLVAVSWSLQPVALKTSPKNPRQSSKVKQIIHIEIQYASTPVEVTTSNGPGLRDLLPAPCALAADCGTTWQRLVALTPPGAERGNRGKVIQISSSGDLGG